MFIFICFYLSWMNFKKIKKHSKQYISWIYTDFTKVYFRPLCCAEACQIFFIEYSSDRRIKPFFRRARTSRAGHLWKTRCAPQHGFSTASKMKRSSVDIIFLCNLEKLEKHFTVNWGIIIKYIHKHYMKQISTK